MIRVAVAAVALALAAAPPAHAATPTITMSGSSVAQAVLADLAYFYSHASRSAPRFSFVGGGTTIGITDVTRGVVDAGMVSRNLGATDPPGLVLTPFALSGVCLVTNRGNPVPGLTRAQVQDLVAGRVTSWTQVPGSTRTDTIVPAALDLTAGARLVFESVFVDPATVISYTPRTFALAAQVRDFVESTPASWGYVDLALAGRLHSMTYNGVPCNRATIRSGAYPAQRPLGVVTRGQPSRALKRFLHWATTSRKGREVIASRYINMPAR
jgi:phosphate transport system substrate-binding protein